MDIEYLVVHCSDSPQGRGDNAETIHKWHQERGWDGIGYHMIILEDGTIQSGRPEYWQGAHVAGYNEISLGVCLMGDVNFTERQMASLYIVLKCWLELYPDAEVGGHCDFDSRKTCPNFDVKAWWASV